MSKNVISEVEIASHSSGFLYSQHLGVGYFCFKPYVNGEKAPRTKDRGDILAEMKWKQDTSR